MRATHRTIEWALFAAFTAACGSPGTPNATSSSTTGGASNVSTGGSAGSQSTAGNAGTTSGGESGQNDGTGGNGGGAISSGGNSGAAGSSAGGSSNACGGSSSVPANPLSEEPGVWVDVSPPGIDIAGTQAGAGTIMADPVRPGDFYLTIQFNGVWKSTDFGGTWTKVSTGSHAEDLDSGFAWYSAIDRNPCRDPETAPTLYATQGYGAGGVWKSTNGGVDWENVWNDNIYADDGTTNISSDVGGDIHCLHIVDDYDPNHLILSLHSYWGEGGNNGVFETTDGGGKWIVHSGQTFNFQPHSDVLFPIDAATWVVGHGATYPNLDIYRTTDSGETWDNVDTETVGIGRAIARTGNTIYSGADFTGHASKSTDLGFTWSQLSGSGGKIGWVATTATKVYVSDGYSVEPTTVRHADLDNDEVWVDDTPTLPGGGIGAAVAFDGTHYVIVAAQGLAGVWRYIEP